jgi:hypothetical protein
VFDLSCSTLGVDPADLRAQLDQISE